MLFRIKVAIHAQGKHRNENAVPGARWHLLREYRDPFVLDIPLVNPMNDLPLTTRLCDLTARRLFRNVAFEHARARYL